MGNFTEEQLNEIKEKTIKFSYANEFNSHIGYEFLELNINYGKARMKCKKELLNPYGSVHGGVLLSLADAVVGTTACMCGYFVTTVSCNMNFLLPAIGPEYIYCEAILLRAGKHIMVYQVKITDETGKLLDSGEYSYFVSDKAILDN